MTVCFVFPVTTIALGIAGQEYSQAPQPIHSVLSTLGRNWPGTAGFSFICMAPAGQLLEHAPHFTPSVITTQVEGSYFARAIWVLRFTSNDICSNAPCGQVCEQVLQLYEQYFLSYLRVGSIMPSKPYSKKAGFIISRPHKTNKLKREPDANIVSETDLLSDI